MTIDSDLLDLGTIWVEDSELGCPVDSDGDGMIDEEDPCPSDPDLDCRPPSPDVITINGREWMQPDLFVNLSWVAINAVCPGGACIDGGVLAGKDMTGWTWASRDTMLEFFNSFGISPPLEIGVVHGAAEKNSAWAPSFFSWGFRPIIPVSSTPDVILGWVSDSSSYSYPPTSAYRDEAHIADREDPDMFDAAGFSPMCCSTNPEVGAWFYRAP